jgi:hypothetical protein
VDERKRGEECDDGFVRRTEGVCVLRATYRRHLPFLSLVWTEYVGLYRGERATYRRHLPFLSLVCTECVGLYSEGKGEPPRGSQVAGDAHSENRI